MNQLATEKKNWDEEKGKLRRQPPIKQGKTILTPMRSPTTRAFIAKKLK